MMSRKCMYVKWIKFEFQNTTFTKPYVLQIWFHNVDLFGIFILMDHQSEPIS